ncbi:peptidoglycan DD-metalloendopeptidase family protein [Georgenia sp. TF02-10]|uniref:peptidoglycan DD-metalloendopeptidase family protein n=1 Tax=Georgenia sp. TF02-10 TaxID=2917725 RepID=UPI001FA747B2|nr:peptidoglycan DD-metalloendopeptidase family protein [Georgenia sp. TF02-10]UNX54069.1 peptidoglycan DD-metalloendopeptidase family protein [Georgenia sp. TF02-10]
MPTGSDLAAAAQRYVGTRYLFGGKTAAGLDCSGLVTLALADLGVPFVHGSSQQIAACEPIPVADAKHVPGALLWRPGHDSVSLGDGRVVEAIRPAVAVTRWTDTYNGTPRWTRAGLIPGITYTHTEPEEPEEEEPMALSSPMEGRFTSGWNPNRYLPGIGRSPHMGVDVAPPRAGTLGTTVHAVEDGVVTKTVSGRKPGQSASRGATLWPGLSGNGVTVRGDRTGLLWHHAHVAPGVAVGQRVKAGQVIGRTDRSGIQTAPHVHLSATRGGRWVDPTPVLAQAGVRLGDKPRGGAAAPAPSKPTTSKPTPEEDEVPVAIEFESRTKNGKAIYVAFPNAREYDHAESKAEIADYRNILTAQGFEYKVWPSEVANPDVFGRYVGPPELKPINAKRTS